jgi:DNA polymerase-3 subunit delta
MKALGASAAVYFFRHAKGLDTARWVRERAAGMNMPIAKDAADLLIASKGRDDLRALAMELEKLALFAGTKRTISREDVTLVSGRSVTATAFDVARAVTAKDRDRALSLLRGIALAARHSAPETVIGALNWRFKLLWKGKRLLSLYRDRDRVLDELRIRREEREAFFSQASGIRMSDLKRGFRLLVNADRAIKTGRSGHEAVLEQLVLRLCGA